MTAMVSVRVAKTNDVSGESAHAFRDKTPSYVDASRSHLNAVLDGDRARTADVRSELERKHLRLVGKAMRKDTKLIWSGVITFSHDAHDIVAMQKGFCDDQARYVLYEIASRWFGSQDAILWLVRHDDESATHYHFALKNQHQKTGRPIRLRRNDFSAMQDIAAAKFEPVGIHRGVRKAERIARGDDASQVIHRTVRELHKDLPFELNAARQKLAKYKRLIDANEQKLLALQSQISDQQLAIQKQQQEIARLQKRLETYRRREDDALNRLKSLSEAISALEHVLDEAQMKAISDAIESVQRVYDDDFLNDPMGDQHSGGFKPSS
jgi:hypothetical protein